MTALETLYGVNLFARERKDATECKRALESLSRPDKQFDSIRIAGSNGKGSVATKIARSLELSGKRVGLFTSPHIESFCERIQVNGKMIPMSRVDPLLNQVFSVAPGLTFFDYTTLIALLYFAEQKVDVAVLEVGLGGRLDATSIVDPTLTIVTSISLEHTQILGNTIEEIAREKTAIFRKGVPAVVGPTVPESQSGDAKRVVGPFSDFEAENRAIAEAACNILGIEPLGIEATPPCRFEEVEPGVIFDVAHNPEALQQLLVRVQVLHPGKTIHVVASFGKEKNIEGCIAAIEAKATLHLVQLDHERAADLHEYKTTPLREAISKAKRHGEIVVVCGTFYLMHDARSCL